MTQLSMHRARSLLACLAVALGAGTPAAAQGDGLDAQRVALVYHRLTNDPLDLDAAAERSDAVQHASTFDRPDVVKQETARLASALAGADPATSFTLSVNDDISQYDHDAGEFSIGLFQPGYYVPIQAFGQQYEIVFANAERARAIKMPKDGARTFDARLNTFGRSVLDEIRFRVTGAGDPAGAVTGERVIRAQIISARILDHAGHELYVPDMGDTSAVASVAAAPAAGVPAFNAALVDVSGFRVGVDADDLAATLARTIGPVERTPADRNAPAGIAGTLSANGSGCFSYPGRRNNPAPGAVCVTALVDKSGTVRLVRVERLFPWIDADVFRKTLVQRYGPVAGAANGSTFTLGWGPTVDTSLVYDRSGPHTALTASWSQDGDYLREMTGSAARIHVVLQLVDADWARKQSR